MDKKFRIIVIEGLDGCFKETISNTLQNLMIGQLSFGGFNIFMKHSFPSYNSITGSAFLVEQYLKEQMFGPAIDLDPVITSGLFISDFNVAIRNMNRHITATVNDKPTLVNPHIYFIFDRYTLSNRIYQKAKFDIKSWPYSEDDLEDRISKMEYAAELPEADCKIFIYMPYDISRKILNKRAHTTGTKLDGHEIDENYMWHVHRRAKEEALRNGYKVIDVDEQCLNSKTYSTNIILPQVVEEVNRVFKSEFNGVTLNV